MVCDMDVEFGTVSAMKGAVDAYLRVDDVVIRQRDEERRTTPTGRGGDGGGNRHHHGRVRRPRHRGRSDHRRQGHCQSQLDRPELEIGSEATAPCCHRSQEGREHGVLILEVAILVPIAMLLFLLVIQMALWA